MRAASQQAREAARTLSVATGSSGSCIKTAASPYLTSSPAPRNRRLQITVPVSYAGTNALSAAHYSSRVPGASRPSRLRAPRGQAKSATSHQGRQAIASTIQHENSHSPSRQDHAQASHPLQASQSASRPTLDHATAIVPRSDAGNSVIDSTDALRNSVAAVLGQPTIVVTREIEMLNVFMGFEQANKYAIVTPEGQQVGYLAEQETGMLGGTLKRQFLKTHRPFEAHILDLQGRVILSIKRGLTFINSKTQIFVVDPQTADQRLVGEVQQVWHPWRRKYELFVNQSSQGNDEMVQFANIDGGILAWDFVMTDEASRPLGAISRNFRGIGRELFTDTGQYVLSFDPRSNPNLQLEAPQSGGPSQQATQSNVAQSITSQELVQSGPARALSMDERAVALATAISADFDYFSRHSSHGHHGFMPFPFFGMGGGAPSPAEGETGGANVPTQGQDSSDVRAPPSAPGTDGGLGPAIGTGVGYDMMGGGREARMQEVSDGAEQPQSPPTDTGNTSPGYGWNESTPYNPSENAPHDFGTGEEEVWGQSEPWSDSTDSGGGGWSIGDFFGGDE